MRSMVHTSHNVQVFITLGLSIVRESLALVLWPGDARFVRTSYYSSVINLGGAVLNLAPAVAFVLAVAATAALFAFMRFSYTGKLMRATAQDRSAAMLMGIDTDRVYALTWAVGTACVGAAGVLLAPIYPVYPTAGLQFVLIAYVAVVLGGLGDMAGALIAALAVAAVEVVGSYTIGTAWKEVLYLLLFIGGLVGRPAGLCGQRGAQAVGTRKRSPPPSSSLPSPDWRPSSRA